MNFILNYVYVMDTASYRDLKNIVEYKNTSIPEFIDLIESFKGDRSTTIFVVYYLKPDKLWKRVPKKYHSSIFTYEETLYNILDNIMVPKHVKSTLPNNISVEDLPIILSYDPIVRRMNFQLGDIICVEGYYRIVK